MKVSLDEIIKDIHTYIDTAVCEEYMKKIEHLKDEEGNIDISSEEFKTLTNEFIADKEAKEDYQIDDIKIHLGTYLTESEENDEEGYKNGTDVAVEAIMAFHKDGNENELDEEWLQHEVELFLNNEENLTKGMYNTRRPAHSVAYDALLSALNVRAVRPITSKQVQAGFRKLGLDFKEILKPCVEYIKQEREAEEEVEPVEEAKEVIEEAVETTLVKVYQLPVGNKNAFMPSRRCSDLSLSDYEEVASFNFDKMESDDEALEAIFTYGNTSDGWQDFEARSISVSDIINFDGKYYFVEPLGFTDVSTTINTDVKEEAEEVITEDVEPAEKIVIINPDDADYYDSLYRVLVYPGAGVELKPFKVYANYEEQALEKLSAYLEEHAPGYMVDIMDMEEDEESMYIYIDGTSEGANEPHYFHIETRVEDITDEVVTESVENVEVESEEVAEAKKSMIDQLVATGISEEKAKETIDYIEDLMINKTAVLDEGVEEYKDKFSIHFMARIFAQMKKDGWDGDILTADQYFDDVIAKLQAGKDLDKEDDKELVLEAEGVRYYDLLRKLELNGYHLTADDVDSVVEDIETLEEDGYDLTDMKDIMMGIGADLGVDAADQKRYANLIHFIKRNEILLGDKDEVDVKLPSEENSEEAKADIENQLDRNYEKLNEALGESNKETRSVMTDEEKKVFDDMKNEPEEKTAYDLLLDRVDQEMTIPELNTLIQDIFHTYNKVYILASDIYNLDLDDTQELTFFDDEDMYTIKYDILDIDTGLIKIKDVIAE